ncbi:30S ribosomal protein S16 [Candidatus Wolfebacteria bacterium RIFCSPLOWO2_01_FULL_38_11]|uniref:Small ribosomal subunit protein bS16 n=1 Tax=Candidatus Wolfebacteria bacterium RIFCSPLOWO2_01_FULL_38_11 TaxID=1802556 RepID=A0A1F8DRP7_9BACT|nr:MAG: 30S ribosomal protein S16 [Candidatus Wolfebacteria bacterium RIFCSPLOWO2_01_FULL_38_11]
MLAIKLKRIGKKGQASYRLIVSEKRSKVFGRCVEDLGWHNPHTNKSKVDRERAGYWLKVGAQPTDSVYNILVKTGVVKAEKKAVHKKSKKQEKEATAPEAQATA